MAVEWHDGQLSLLMVAIRTCTPCSEAMDLCSSQSTAATFTMPANWMKSWQNSSHTQQDQVGWQALSSDHKLHNGSLVSSLA